MLIRSSGCGFQFFCVLFWGSHLASVLMTLKGGFQGAGIEQDLAALEAGAFHPPGRRAPGWGFVQGLSWLVPKSRPVTVTQAGHWVPGHSGGGLWDGGKGAFCPEAPSPGAPTLEVAQLGFKLWASLIHSPPQTLASGVEARPSRRWRLFSGADGNEGLLSSSRQFCTKQGLPKFISSYLIISDRFISRGQDIFFCFYPVPGKILPSCHPCLCPGHVPILRTHSAPG